MAAKKSGNGKTRGRPRRAMVQDDADVVERNELDLGEPVSIDTGTFQLHMRAIKGAMEKKDTAMSLLRNCFKAAKEVNEHLPFAIREVLKEERADDMGALREKLEVFGIALREIGSPIQLTIHNALLGDVGDQADARGFKDAKEGKGALSPYPKATDLDARYMDGWKRGTALNMGMTAEDADAALAARASDRPAGEGHNSDAQF